MRVNYIHYITYTFMNLQQVYKTLFSMMPHPILSQGIDDTMEVTLKSHQNKENG